MSDTIDVTARAAEVRPDRVIGDLRELAALTGGPDGARRLCWTPEWQKARDWLRARYPGLPYTLAGFSFGSRTILRLGCELMDAERLIAGRDKVRHLFSK